MLIVCVCADPIRAVVREASYADVIGNTLHEILHRLPPPMADKYLRHLVVGICRHCLNVATSLLMRHWNDDPVGKVVEIYSRKRQASPHAANIVPINDVFLDKHQQLLKLPEHNASVRRMRYPRRAALLSQYGEVKPRGVRFRRARSEAKHVIPAFRSPG